MHRKDAENAMAKAFLYGLTDIQTENRDALPMIYFTEYASPVGTLTISANDTSLIGLYIQNQKYYPTLTNWQRVSTDENPVLTAAINWLDLYFSAQNPPTESLSLSPQGTPFRQQVWRHLCRIPYGQTTTYGALAKEIAAENNIPSMSAQAIGNAVGHNPISIIIPCHRVVGADGNLTGYAAGTDIKLKLLALEGIDTTKLSK